MVHVILLCGVVPRAWWFIFFRTIIEKLWQYPENIILDVAPGPSFQRYLTEIATETTSGGSSCGWGCYVLYRTPKWRPGIKSCLDYILSFHYFHFSFIHFLNFGLFTVFCCCLTQYYVNKILDPASIAHFCRNHSQGIFAKNGCLSPDILLSELFLFPHTGFGISQ